MTEASRRPERSRFRQTKPWLEFRAGRLLAVGHRCEMCGGVYKGIRARKLQVHHLNPADYEDLTPDNFRVLCYSCHEWVEIWTTRVQGRHWEASRFWRAVWPAVRWFFAFDPRAIVDGKLAGVASIENRPGVDTGPDKREDSSMGLTISGGAGGPEFKRLEPGTYVGRLVGLYDLGTQETTWQGKVKKGPKVVLEFEVLDPDQVRDDGKPFKISSTMTASLHEKASLRQMIEAWRGRPFTEAEVQKFELGVLAGQYALVSVVRETGTDGRQYTSLKSVAPLMKGQAKPAGVWPVVVFDLSTKDALDIYDKLPEWMRTKIAASPEWASLSGETHPGGFVDDDLPAF